MRAVTLAPLLLLGPLALTAPTSTSDAIEREMVADHARIDAYQRCLLAVHRLRTLDRPDGWPFAQRPLDVEEDALRCRLR